MHTLLPRGIGLIHKAFSGDVDVAIKNVAERKNQIQQGNEDTTIPSRTVSTVAEGVKTLEKDSRTGG
jgi:hypothetical protein